MPDPEGTKPPSELETKPEGAELTKPEAGREAGAVEPSEAGAQPSETVKRSEYEAAVRDMNEKQKEAAEAKQRLQQIEQEREHYRRIAEAAVGREQQRADPLLQADAELAQALTTYDPNTVLQAQRKRDAIRDERSAHAIRQQVLRDLDYRDGMERARPFGVNDPQELLTFRQTLSPGEEIEALALYRARKNGKLPEYLASETKAKDERRKSAELLQSLGQSGGRQIPGNPDGNARSKKKVDWVSYASKNKASRAAIDKLVEAGEVELTNRPGEGA